MRKPASMEYEKIREAERIANKAYVEALIEYVDKFGVKATKAVQKRFEITDKSRPWIHKEDKILKVFDLGQIGICELCEMYKTDFKNGETCEWVTMESVATCLYTYEYKGKVSLNCMRYIQGLEDEDGTFERKVRLNVCHMSLANLSHIHNYIAGYEQANGRW